RPLCAPLFPYTTLFRSAQHHRGHADEKRADGGDGRVDLEDEAVPDAHGERLDLDAGEKEGDQQLVERGEEGEERGREKTGQDERSEEHTSELQSLAYLV